MAQETETKFSQGDRVKIVEKLFPSFDEGLFNGLPKVGQVIEVDPGTILPYRVKIDTFGHHPFWFYENQLAFEDDEKEQQWQEAKKQKAAAKAGSS